MIKKLIVITAFFAVLILHSSSFATTRIFYEDFDDHSTNDGWYHNNANLWDRTIYDQPDCPEQYWTLTTTGAYSGKSAQASAGDPSSHLYGESANMWLWNFAEFTTWDDEIFVRWKAKFPVNFNSSFCNGDSLVIWGASGGCYIQISMGSSPYYGPWWQVSGCNNNDSAFDGLNFITDNAWHEYAVYYKNPSSSGQNFIYRMWIDKTSYTSENADWSLSSHVNEPLSEIMIPQHWKSTNYPPTNYGFMIDNVEVWDGIPTGGTTPPSKVMGVSGSSVESYMGIPAGNIDWP